MHPQRRYSASKFTCLKQVIEHADELARGVVYVCRCPYCAELLILPPQPVAVRLPIVFEDEP